MCRYLLFYCKFIISMPWCYHFCYSPDAEFLARLASVQEQREQHRAELARWQQALRSAAQLVRQARSQTKSSGGALCAPLGVHISTPHT